MENLKRLISECEERVGRCDRRTAELMHEVEWLEVRLPTRRGVQRTLGLAAGSFFLPCKMLRI